MSIDYSQLSTYISCPQKYYLAYVRGLKKRSIDETNIDVAFGEMVHKSLERYYLEGRIDFAEQWKDFKDLPNEMSKTKSNGIVLMDEYVKHYKDIDKTMDILDVEAVSKIMIGNIEYKVKIDMIIRLNGNIYVVDHKTAKDIPYNYFSRFSPNMQISGYTEYAKERFGQCSGCIINVLQAGFRQRAYRGEPAGFHCKFQREIVSRDLGQLQDFRDNVYLWDKKLAAAFETASWGKNENHCHQYRGCQYKELCMTSKGIELDESIEDVLYEKIDAKAYLNGGSDEVLSV